LTQEKSFLEFMKNLMKMFLLQLRGLRIDPKVEILGAALIKLAGWNFLPKKTN